MDDDALGLLGICAGGGYAVGAAMIERRFKAIGTVVASNVGANFRRAGPRADAIDKLLAEVGRQRTIEARGEPERRLAWLPSRGEADAAGIEDPSLSNAIDYYDTARGYSDNRTNRRLFTSDALIVGFDAFHLVGELLVQPLQVIVGGKLGTTFSYADGRSLWERARNRRDFVVIEGADHYDMYDRTEFVDQAVAHLVALYDEELRHA